MNNKQMWHIYGICSHCNHKFHNHKLIGGDFHGGRNIWGTDGCRGKGDRRTNKQTNRQMYGIIALSTHFAAGA